MSPQWRQNTPIQMVSALTTEQTISNPRFLNHSAAFARSACFAKMLTPPTQHRVDGVSIWALSGVGGGFNNRRVRESGSDLNLTSKERRES